MFRSLAGLTLELGDRLLINGEEVIFKGWVDQSQTAIEVALAESASAESNSEIKRIHAKSIRTLSRSPFASSANATNESANESTNSESTQSESTQSKTGDRTAASSNSAAKPNNVNTQDSDVKVSNAKVSESENSAPENIADNQEEPSGSAEPPQSQELEIPPEPEYNAWEVWTYLERQRLKTLKLLNTFQAEWEANRFVREAERNTPPNLRVHYEIRPVVLDESIINSANAENRSPSASTEPSKPSSAETTEIYTDAIDVEVIG